MNPRPAPQPVGARRFAFWFVFAGGALVLLLAGGWWKQRSGAAAGGRLPAAERTTVSRGQLELRAERYYQAGQTQPFSGGMTDTYPGGQPKLQTPLVDGQYQGVSEGWTTNGVLELRETFAHGLAEGPRTTWHPNGSTRSEGFLTAGKQEGRYRQWDEAGVLVAEAEFNAGEPHGLARAWYPSGCLKAEARMNHGQVAERFLYPDGERRAPALLAAAPSPKS